MFICLNDDDTVFIVLSGWALPSFEKRTCCPPPCTKIQYYMFKLKENCFSTIMITLFCCFCLKEFPLPLAARAIL